MKFNKKQIEEVNESLEVATVNPDDISGTIKLFLPLIIFGLSIAKIFTNKEADAKIDELIAVFKTL